MTGPAVVAMLPPLGESREHFDRLRPLLPDVRLVDLDRPVMGLTGLTADQLVPEPGRTAPRGRRTAREDAERAAADLRDLVGPDTPVVLLGASYGGLVARLLVDVAAGSGGAGPRIAGLVLVDSPHEYLARALAGLVGPAPQLSVANAEKVDLAESFREAGRRSAPGSLGDLPLAILARHRGPWPAGGRWADVADRLWRGHQRMLLPLSSRSRYVEVLGSDYHVCRDRADAVAEAVGEVLAQLDAP